MKNKQIFRGLAALAGIALCTVSFSAMAAQLRIIQTNFAGDSIHIIDPATNKVVNEIKGFEATHGITVAPDGSRIYISSEDDFTLAVIDGKTLKVTKRIPLSGNPNLIDITPDGQQIYVAIALNYNDLSDFPRVKADASGGVDVIDTVSLQKVKTISMKGGVHDLNVSPDGKYVFVGNARGGKANVMTVVDTQDQRRRVDDADGSIPLSDGGIEKSRRLDQVDIRAKWSRQWISSRGFCDAKDNQYDQASGHHGPNTGSLRTARRVSRHHGHPGSENASGQQQDEQRPLCVLAAGPEAAGGSHSWREGGGLVDDHARRQDGLCGQ